jgi:hypothetical protein
MLIRRYPVEGSTNIAKELGISPKAVRVRAHRLGLVVGGECVANPPPKPRAGNFLALGVRSGYRLQPVPAEDERKAIEAFLATREVTKCPPGHAFGLSPQYVGKERFT